MLFFGKKQRIDKSGYLDCFTDYHSHILPGVDDGVRTMEESLSILALYEQVGIVSLWCTPHIMEDIPNATEDLRVRFDELTAAYAEDRKSRGAQAPAVELHLASENMLDTLFEKRLEKNDFLPILGNRLLVETSYYNPPYNLYALLDAIKSVGYHPILAHPERYIYMSENDYSALRARGVQFQMNLFSLIGSYGDVVKSKAEYLLKNSCYSFVGTDLHKKRVFESALTAKISVKTLDTLKQICF